MRELCLTLDFACCACAGRLTMEVKCGGLGLLTGSPYAGVAVACPLCEECNDLIFDTDGRVHQVARRSPGVCLANPSMN